MNPTTTEIEEVEMNSPTSRYVDSRSGSINSLQQASKPPSVTGELTHDSVHHNKFINLLSFHVLTNYTLFYTDLEEIGGFRTSNPKPFLGKPPSFYDVQHYHRSSSFGERPRLSIGDLLDIPSVPPSPQRSYQGDQSYSLYPELPRRKNPSATGSPPNPPSGELVDKDSIGINNIPTAPLSPQHLSNVDIKQEHTIKIPSTSEELYGRYSAEDATNTKDQGHTDNIPSPTLPGKAPPNLPCEDLLDSRADYYSICVPLYEASITGNWKSAKVFLDQYPKLVQFAITENYQTALHVATLAEETKRTECFVENLVNLMTGEDLELQDSSYNTAFCVAAKAGNIKMIKIMLKKNPNLLNIPGSNRMMPLYMSALFGKYETVKYLYDLSDNMASDFWTTKYQDWMLENCVECGFFDVAIKIVEKHPTLAMNGSVLGILARKPDAIFDGVEQKLLTRIINSIFRTMNMKVGPAEKDSDALKLLRIIWRDAITMMPKSQVDDILRGPRGSITRDGRPQYPFRILFVAAEMGNTRFVIKLLQAHPRLIVSRNDELQTIFHVAVMNRHCDIHNLVYEIGAQKDVIIPLRDRDGNNMLHLIGKTSVKMRPKTFGASLLMQRELLWFKEIEMMMLPALRQSRNNVGQTPYELFSEENKDLVVQGLKWMKDCMVVATLIVTVAFAVAFTVPGGYNQQIGTPIFIHGRSFLVFVIADAISLFCSSTSLLVFLSILTSRHGQHDFMYALPTKLMIGLATLFISVAAMMVTFSASFFVLYGNRLKWVPILIATFAAMPVVVFAILQLPLLVDMFRSMYDSRYLFKRNKHMLYKTNLRF
ncbi:hypothetical protein L6452_14283 [Arctium lappa]|uniref:Uncharacterized protein n=1 Tax=Arctium lappa TaxID=4217 RepID=A0ACB9CKH1_ARCLA|nr:hypothetical protein L6452_14283 [Arctium lappa]